MTIRSFPERESGVIQVDAERTDPPEVGALRTGSSGGSRHRARLIRILEVLLILFAILRSGLLSIAYQWSHGTLFARLHVEGWQWAYLFVYEAGPLGILSYILYCNSRGSSTDTTSQANFKVLAHKPDAERRSFRTFELLMVLYVAFALGVIHSLGVAFGGAVPPPRPASATWLYDV